MTPHSVQCRQSGQDPRPGYSFGEVTGCWDRAQHWEYRGAVSQLGGSGNKDKLSLVTLHTGRSGAPGPLPIMPGVRDGAHLSSTYQQCSVIMESAIAQ